MPLSEQDTNTTTYHRYHIETAPTPEIVAWPNRFIVKVSKIGLAKLLLTEIISQKGDIKAVTSRPCMYGTFSGPVGGFVPRPEHCVGCLRCTIQHPEMVQILPNPARQDLGDSYIHFQHINAISYEAETGNIPVKGAGFRGRFSGEGWDAMWTDMSEIVRPTRDGIHGREFISTVVDLGEKPAYLIFDPQGKPENADTRFLTIPLPFLFDIPPVSVLSPLLIDILVKCADEIETLVVVPVSMIANHAAASGNVIPLVKTNEAKLVANLPEIPKLIEIDGHQATLDGLENAITSLKNTCPDSILILRLPFMDDNMLMSSYKLGLRFFHLVADLHGHDKEGHFVSELIRRAHTSFVDAGVRDEISLIGSGGITAAEHIPKAIMCGLDAVALDTPLLAALQAQFIGECADRTTCQITLPNELSLNWGVQRLKNLSAAWHDQLLEILGAMGLREVRRMRGEVGRAMFHIELEQEAFAEIEGYET
jgi:hypothetical protein